MRRLKHTPESSASSTHSHPHNHEPRTSRRDLIASWLLGGTALTVLAVGIKDIKDERLRGDVFGGELNPDITSIEIHDGARLRSSPDTAPYAAFSNRLTTVETKSDTSSVIIHTPQGVFETFNRSSFWYGIRVEDLNSAYNFGDLNIDISVVKPDRDEIVWVNEIRANPVKYSNASEN